MSIVDTFVHAVSSGPLLLALPFAAAAGLVSFLSPCVLPLMPGYLSYVTGLSGDELGVAAGSRRHRTTAGAALFVVGFSAVFVSEGLLFGGLGALLIDHRLVIERVLGAVTIVMGLAFLDLVPGLQRQLTVRRMPATGLAGAPVLGVVFGLGWTPCLGPTLAAVQGLAFTQASAGRGAILTAAYCLGLGVPFVLGALGVRRALGAFAAVKRHYGVVKAVGGGLLVLVGVLLVTGVWEQVTIALRVYLGGYSAAV